MKRLFTILSIALLAVCCKEEDTQQRRFEVNGIRDSYEFAADLNQKEYFEVVSDNVLWEISFSPEDQDWLTVSPMRSLGGYQTVTIAADNNASVLSRTCAIILTSEDGYEKTVFVTQRGK